MVYINGFFFLVLYKEGPGITHADFIVVIKFEDRVDDWIATLGHVRMANTTVKVCYQLSL